MNLNLKGWLLKKRKAFTRSSTFHFARRTRKNNRNGFTLIELLVASLLTTLVILVAWSGLISLMNLSAVAEAKSLRQLELNKAIDFVAQDLRTAQWVNATATHTIDSTTPDIGNLLSQAEFDLSRLGSYGDLALYLEIPLKGEAPAICPVGGPNAGKVPPTPSTYDQVIYDIRNSPSEWIAPRTLMRYGRLKDPQAGFNPCANPVSSDPIADALSDDTTSQPNCSGTLTGGSGFYTCGENGQIQIIFQHALVNSAVSEVSSGASSRVRSIQATPLENVGCQNEPTLRSQNANSPTNIAVVNDTSSVIKIYWLDYSGTRIHYADLEGNSTFSHSTFLTHPWLITNQSDRCLGIYMPKESDGVITITAEGLPGGA